MNICKEMFICTEANQVFKSIESGALFEATGVEPNSLSLNFKESGTYELSWGPVGSCTGVFKNIVKNSKIVFSWVKTEAAYTNEPVETLVEILLFEDRKGTKLTLNHTGFTDKKAFDSHNEGWDSVLDEFGRKF